MRVPAIQTNWMKIKPPFLFCADTQSIHVAALTWQTHGRMPLLTQSFT
jgi:hypothetical protein